MSLTSSINQSLRNSDSDPAVPAKESSSSHASHSTVSVATPTRPGGMGGPKIIFIFYPLKIR
jgi:hypothetical protein